MSPRNYITIGLALIMVFLIQLGSNYAYRYDDRQNKILGCERVIKDRQDSVGLATAVRDGFKATDDRVGKPLTKARINAEARVQMAINGFTFRAKIDCTKAYPPVPIIQFT